MGSWRPAELLAFTCGIVRVVLFGACLASREEAVVEAKRAVGTGGYDRLAGLPGSFHLAVAQPHGSTAYADVAGLRRLFYAEHASTVVYASHVRMLGELTAAALDEEWLASRLVCPALLHTRGHRTAFRGVRPVPAAHRLAIDNHGTVTVARYWQVPADTRPLVSSAPQLRTQLTRAVHERVSRVSRVTTDLSGGLDSTSLSFLAAGSAAATSASMCTLTFPAASPANDDLAFAQAAAAAQPQIEHVFVEPDEFPLPYQDLSGLPPLDEPASFAMSIARVCHLGGVLVGLGSRVHLSGHGGDAVLLAPLAYLRRALRSHPLVTLAHIRLYAALQRQPTAMFVAQLARTGSYRAWLAATARGPEGAADRPDLGLGWGIPPQVPCWITGDALAAVRDVLTYASTTLEPLAPDPGQHAAMERILMLGGVVRLYRDALATMGVDVEWPYLDGAVVETCLATRAHERTDPSRAKPLLIAALGDLVPTQLLGRRTKGHYDTDLHLGLRQHRGTLFDTLGDDSRLAALGLVDAAALRAACHRLVAGQQGSLAQLNETLACELWLRTIDPAGSGGALTHQRGVA